MTSWFGDSREREQVEQKNDPENLDEENMNIQINSQRGGPAEADAIGSQADAISPDGVRMGSSGTEEQIDTTLGR